MLKTKVRRRYSREKEYVSCNKTSSNERNSTVGGRGVMRCFRCDRPGHRAVDCSIPSLSLGKSNGMGTGLFNLNQLEKSGENRRKQELYTTNYWMIVMKMIVKNFQLLW
uniref:CCHC-type domain-containing protein n=1 Tax=Micrurus lemniscatus lemniscatus TaxID=129467 RepID=A0A2D4HPA1_MICLE